MELDKSQHPSAFEWKPRTHAKLPQPPIAAPHHRWFKHHSPHRSPTGIRLKSTQPFAVRRMDYGPEVYGAGGHKPGARLAISAGGFYKI